VDALPRPAEAEFSGCLLVLLDGQPTGGDAEVLGRLADGGGRLLPVLQLIVEELTTEAHVLVYSAHVLELVEVAEGGEVSQQCGGRVLSPRQARVCWLESRCCHTPKM
jgi:hypothetical protein